MAARILAFLLASVSAHAFSSCIPPAQPCGNLKPNLVIFIGREISRSSGPRVVPTVTFDVQEWLWNGNGARTVSVRFYDGHSRRPALQFVAALPETDGAYSVTDCGAGFALPAEDEQARRFRQDILRRTESTLRVYPHSHHNPLYDADIEFAGERGVFTSSHSLGDLLRSWSGVFDRIESLHRTLALPPGDYTLASANPRYAVEPTERKTNISPGSCASLRVNLRVPNSVTGRFLNAARQPLANATLHLGGEARSGHRNHRAKYSATTNAQGEFRFESVLPGWYYLVTDVSAHSSNTTNPPLPKLFYPGVPHWSHAIQIVVEEGRPLVPLEYPLPDLGRSIDVTLIVQSEDGVPIADAVVGIRGSRFLEPFEASLYQQVFSDRNGRATVRVWSAWYYEIWAIHHIPGDSLLSPPVLISSGLPSSSTLVVNGLRLRNGILKK